MSYRILFKTFKFIFCFLFIFQVSYLEAQFQTPGVSKTDSIGYVYITGKVERNRKPLDNAHIIIYEGGEKIANISSSPTDGKFSFKLEFGKYFNVEITKAGMVVKKFEFDTHLPEEVSNKVIYTFDFAIALFPKYDYIDMGVLEKPLAIIMYQKRYDAFFYEYEYAKSINDRVIELENKIEELIKEYDLNIQAGRKLFDLEKYLEALTKFEKAHNIFPDEPYPIEQIALIKCIMNKDKNKKELYAQLIIKAEESVKQMEYQNAIDLLGQAIEVLPTEKYPVERIREIKRIMNKLKIKEDKYNLAIQKADDSFINKMYTEAEIYYTEASSFYPDRPYPKDKIEEIHKILSNKNKEALYENSVKEGDKLFSLSKYLEAFSAYKNALTYKPDAKYPKERIELINKRLNELSYIEGQYKKAVAEADSLMNEKDFENAKIEYVKASKFKPSEQYPIDRINEIDRITKLLGVRNGKYPELQLSNMNIILESQNKRMESHYKKLILIADSLENNKEYAKAKSIYQDASDIKPEDNYPKAKIKIIEQILKEENEKNTKYYRVTEQAEISYEVHQYSKAKSLYQQASELLPEDNYSKEKVKELDKIINTKQPIAAEYSIVVASADTAMTLKNYEKAKELYERAAEIKPQEKYPKNKLKEIEDLFKKFESNIVYNSLIFEADDLYDLKNYKEARNIYINASKINPIQKYPKLQIEKINKILVSIEYDKAIEAVYNELVEQLKEKKFTFNPLRDKGKTNYIVLDIKNLSQKPFKVLVFYGKNEECSGGFEVEVKNRKIPLKYIVRVGNQENWSNVDNNWVSVQPVGGYIEVSNIKIYKGE